jgi:transposase
MLPPVSKMTRSPSDSIRHARLSASGASGFSESALPDSRKNPGAGDPPDFPPRVIVEIKRLACELPYRLGLPLARFSMADLQRAAINRGIVASIGKTTIWRWLSEDAIRPWRVRSWIFPNDPDFREKAVRVLDLYQGIWKGRRLGPDDYVISADEKTSIQARQREHVTVAPAPGRSILVEHRYKRMGAWAYLAAWDVRRAKVFGRCEVKTGMVPFDRLVAQVMSRAPYRSARRVFWIMDNGSSHRGCPCIERLQKRWPNIIVVHTPRHASWLNQIEIYFSIVQRKVLTPNDFQNRDELADDLLCFQTYYEEVAKPFQWKFTRRDLDRILAKLDDRSRNRAAA